MDPSVEIYKNFKLKPLNYQIAEQIKVYTNLVKQI